jgi:hypothetical protein
VVTAKKSEDIPEEEAQEPAPSGPVPVPNNSARPPDVAPANTTFATRAKAQGTNKRVEQSESK